MSTASTNPMPRNAAPSFDLTAATIMLSSVCGAMVYLTHPALGVITVALLMACTMLLVAYQKPFVLIAALVAVGAFNYGHAVGPATLKLSEVVCFAMAGLIGWRVLILHPRVLYRLRRLAFPFTVLAVLSALACITASIRPHVFNVRYELQNYIALAFGALFFRRKRWPALARTFFWVLLLTAVGALVIRFVLHLSTVILFSDEGNITVGGIGQDYVDLAGGGRFRLAGTLGHKNIFAAFIILLAPLVGIDLVRKLRPTYVLAMIPIIAALALSDSMTGWGAAVVILAITLVLFRRFDYLAICTLLALPTVGVALYKFGDSVFFRINQLLFTDKGWTTVSARGEIYKLARQLIHDNPWIGIGRNNFMELSHSYYPHAHNLYVMKMVEMGIPGGVIFTLFCVGLMLYTGRTLVIHAARLASHGEYYYFLGLWLGCAGVLAMNLFDYSYSSFALGPVLMLGMGILLATACDLESRENVWHEESFTGTEAA